MNWYLVVDGVPVTSFSSREEAVAAMWHFLQAKRPAHVVRMRDWLARGIVEQDRADQHAALAESLCARMN